jgi:hypothetical protein
MPKIIIPPTDSMVYIEAVRRLAFRIGIEKDGKWHGADSLEGIAAYKLAHVAMEALKECENRKYSDYKYPTTGEKILKVITPILLFIPRITAPLWGWAFVRYMSPSKAAQVEYEIYSRSQGYPPDTTLDSAVLKAESKNG